MRSPDTVNDTPEENKRNEDSRLPKEKETQYTKQYDFEIVIPTCVKKGNNIPQKKAIRNSKKKI